MPDLLPEKVIAERKDQHPQVDMRAPWDAAGHLTAVLLRRRGERTTATGAILSHPAPLESGIINYRAAIAMTLAHGCQSPFLREHYGGDGLSVCAANRAYLQRILPANRETSR